MENPLQLAFVNFKKDSYIIVEGKQNADRFYIVRSGKVRISKEVEVVEEEGGNVMGPGDFFGVVSTMSSHSHIETAQAMTDCTLICVQREQFGLLIEKNTPVAMKIIMGFSKRMRYLDEALMRLTIKNSTEADPSHLFRVAEYYARQSQYNQAFYAYYQYIKFCPVGQYVVVAKERMDKIKPYAKAVYLDGSTEEFNRFYPKDTMVFTEGMPGSELYIIQKGSVKITKIMDNSEVLLAVLKPGDIFGEMAILENKPRSASAVALSDVTAYSCRGEDFARLLAESAPGIGKVMGRMMESTVKRFKLLEAKSQSPGQSESSETDTTSEGRLMQAIAHNEIVRVSARSGLTAPVEGLFHIVDLSNGLGTPLIRIALTKEAGGREYVLPLSSVNYVSFKDSSGKY